jgi:hypothetical protein
MVPRNRDTLLSGTYRFGSAKHENGKREKKEKISEKTKENKKYKFDKPI